MADGRRVSIIDIFKMPMVSIVNIAPSSARQTVSISGDKHAESATPTKNTAHTNHSGTVTRCKSCMSTYVYSVYIHYDRPTRT